MQKLYENSTWKWDARKKSEEMFDDDAWFLIAEKEEVISYIKYFLNSSGSIPVLGKIFEMI